MTSLMAPIPTEPITFTTPGSQSLCCPIASLIPSCPHPCSGLRCSLSMYHPMSMCCPLYTLHLTPHAFMSSSLPVKKSSLVTSSFSPHPTLLFSHHCTVSQFFNMLVLKSQMDL